MEKNCGIENSGGDLVINVNGKPIVIITPTMAKKMRKSAQNMVVVFSANGDTAVISGGANLGVNDGAVMTTETFNVKRDEFERKCERLEYDEVNGVVISGGHHIGVQNGDKISATEFKKRREEVKVEPLARTQFLHNPHIDDDGTIDFRARV